MAGSYNHIIDKHGKFDGLGVVENLGDAWEAFEEMFGMIWWLANGSADEVERARKNYERGIEMSPGRTKKSEY